MHEDGFWLEALKGGDHAAFERLYERLPATKERMVLPGRGHLFDWPNTYFIWEKMLAWLECNF